MVDCVTTAVEQLHIEGPNAVTVGMFDGVHRGHATLVQTLCSKARALGGRGIVLTFDRHPSEVVSPEKTPQYLTTIKRKAKLLREYGADEVVVLEFNQDVAALSPEEFAADILVKRLNTRAAVVSRTFRFGTGRSGNADQLKSLGEAEGFEVTVVPPVEAHGAIISSTRIRSLISHGRVKDAADLLGRPFELPGRVVAGIGVGAALGFPTANLAPPEKHIIPAKGVYAGSVLLDNELLPAAINIGERPTIAPGELLVEAHILDFQGELYGREMTIVFVDRLRDEKKFPSRAKLAEQIKRDVEIVRAILSA